MPRYALRPFLSTPQGFERSGLSLALKGAKSVALAPSIAASLGGRSLGAKSAVSVLERAVLQQCSCSSCVLGKVAARQCCCIERLTYQRPVLFHLGLPGCHLARRQVGGRQEHCFARRAQR